MNLKPPAPYNSITGLAWTLIVVVALIVAYRKFAPAAITKYASV